MGVVIVNYNSFHEIQNFIGNRYQECVKKGYEPDFFVCDEDTLKTFVTGMTLFGVEPCYETKVVRLIFPTKELAMFSIPTSHRFISAINTETWKWEK
jgi:hypothetical protein